MLPVIDAEVSEVNAAGACLPDKAEGALLCSAAGDALGWPQELPKKTIRTKELAMPSREFREWIARRGWGADAHEEIVRKGEYSDDTQLTLAVARARMLGDDEWFTAFARTELPLWTLYQRGAGRATRQATENWVNGTPPWSKSALRGPYFRAGGNGVAMRVLPHAIYHCGADDPSQLIRDVILDGTATHGHPRALVGAAAVAFAAWWLLRLERTVEGGEIIEVIRDSASAWGRLQVPGDQEDDWLELADRATGRACEAVWKRVCEELLEYLAVALRGIEQGASHGDTKTLADLRCFGKEKGSGVVTAAASIYLCARYAATPVQGVLAAAFAHGSDTDTIAAIAGGLLGCLAGAKRLPRSWRAVQDGDYIRASAERLVRRSAAAAGVSAKPRSIDRPHLEEIKRVLASGHSETFDFDGVREAAIVGSMQAKPLSKSARVLIRELRTSDGQRLYMKDFGRTSAAA